MNEKRAKFHKTVFVTKADPFELHIDGPEFSSIEKNSNRTLFIDFIFERLAAFFFSFR